MTTLYFESAGSPSNRRLTVGRHWREGIDLYLSIHTTGQPQNDSLAVSLTAEDTWDLIRDLIELVGPPPEPTFQEQFAALPIGTQFELLNEFGNLIEDGDRRIKVADTHYTHQYAEYEPTVEDASQIVPQYSLRSVK